MKEEARKKLDHLIFMQRVKFAGMVASIGMTVLGLMLFIGYAGEQKIDKVTTTTAVHGTILQARIQSGGTNIYQLQVKLDDGRSIKTYSQRSAGIPYKGEQVDLTEMLHKSGLKNYKVTHLIRAPKG